MSKSLSKSHPRSTKSKRSTYPQGLPPFGKKSPQLIVKHPPHPHVSFEPLPAPTGQYPYHLSLENILPAGTIASIKNSGTMTFHVAGDTGGINDSNPQQAVSDAMQKDYDLEQESRPSFFYHLGDVVYFYGEAEKYYEQYYDPYLLYPGDIFAIPGNHDGLLPKNSNIESLKAFKDNFCTETREIGLDARDARRKTMTQPNFYWTLDTPLATMIGLYSNVPEGGEFHPDQVSWFVDELKKAPTNKALIVSVHHPQYSLDIFKSGSPVIKETLDGAFEESSRYPDIVFSGHVHNYQRFTRNVDKRDIPYIVAGAGGYPHLHAMQKVNGEPIQVPYNPSEYPDVTLENYYPHSHGYMIAQVTRNTISGQYYAVASSHNKKLQVATKVDSFELDWKQHKLTSSTFVP